MVIRQLFGEKQCSSALQTHRMTTCKWYTHLLPHLLCLDQNPRHENYNLGLIHSFIHVYLGKFFSSLFIRWEIFFVGKIFFFLIHSFIHVHLGKYCYSQQK